MSTDIPAIAAFELVDGIPIVRIAGEVDIANRAALEHAIYAAAEEDAGTVIVSLERATYFDSAIIHVIMRARVRLRTHRQSLVVVRPSFAAGRRILEIAGLLDPETSFETTEDALAAAAAIRAERSPG